MSFENYIDEIAQLIESNINRINSRNLLKNIHYHYSSENIFELSIEEHKKLSEIVNEISNENNLNVKFPKNYIFDQFVYEVIIKSYNLDSTYDEIKSNLKLRFNEFEEILNKGFKNGLILYLFQVLKLMIKSILIQWLFIHLNLLKMKY